MSKCPYCNADEVINDFHTSNQMTTSDKFTCGTEIVYFNSTQSCVNWDCRNGVQPVIDYSKLVASMDSKARDELISHIRRLR